MHLFLFFGMWLLITVVIIFPVIWFGIWLFDWIYFKIDKFPSRLFGEGQQIIAGISEIISAILAWYLTLKILGI